MAGAEHGTKAVVVALCANLAIAVAKFVGFLLTGASSMLAESVHSVADSGNQGLLLFGGKRARRAATVEHPFGYARTRYFWSFVVAVVLFALGSLFSLFEGVHKLAHPEPLRSLTIAVIILCVAIALEGYAFTTAVGQANHTRGMQSWWGFIRHSKSPELPVILLEDFGALVGLVLALVGLGLATLTGQPAWDAYATLAIGTLLGVIAIVLAVEMKSLLIGEAASTRDLEQIRAAITGTPNVADLIHVKTQHLGPDELLVAAKVRLDPSLSFNEVVATIDAAERTVRETVPAATVMYIEPDIEPDIEAAPQPA
ncbi:MAG: cation diffusion facilitator family transporter [Actinomycetota bacterium]|nr:cation diffusion facilitator family transporter [Actinomycetota bacterium]